MEPLGCDPETAFEPNGLLDDLKKALDERALNAEMDHHLANGEAGDSCNGDGKKTVTTETNRIELDIPRDRQSTFDPQLIAKYQRRFPGFDEKIVSIYARGMSVRESVGHLRDLYGVDVSSLALLASGITQPPKAAFVTRLRPVRLLVQAARQLPDQSTTLWVEPSSTGDTPPPGRSE
jgi:putative transposase